MQDTVTKSARYQHQRQRLKRWWDQLTAARWIWFPLVVFGITRLGIALVAYIATPVVIDPSYAPSSEAPNNVLRAVFTDHWDSAFYMDIARYGYRYSAAELSSVAFFPLLPLLMRIGMYVVGDAALAGVLIANSALLLATMLLFRLVAPEWGNAIADRTIWYLLIFPVSFFGSAIYSESIFLLCAVGSLLCARRGLWLGAAAFGMLTALTRFVGIIIAPMLLVEWWTQSQRHTKDDRPPLGALLAPCAVPLGTLAYMFYLRRTFGDPLAFVHASEAWGRTPQSPLDLVRSLAITSPESWWTALLAGRIPLDGWIDALFVVSFVILGAVLLRSRRWSEAVFVLLGILIPLNSGLLASQRRYMWVLFPAFVVLACWGERPWIDRLLTTLFLLGLGLFTAMFANWYWVA